MPCVKVPLLWIQCQRPRLLLRNCMYLLVRSVVNHGRTKLMHERIVSVQVRVKQHKDIHCAGIALEESGVAAISWDF
jgi:hypothetical protein